MLILYGFMTAVSFVLSIVIKRLSDEKRIKAALWFRGERTISDIKKLDPSGDAVTLSVDFIIHKLTIVLLIVCAGSFLAFMYELREYNALELINGNLIQRNGYGLEAKNVRLKVREVNTQEADTIDISVSERRYTDEELDVMAAQAEELLYDTVILDNESLDMIKTDMSFPAALEEYPFRISWRTDDPLLISNKGTIDTERLERLGKTKDIYNGVLTGIHAELIYEDYIREMDFSARIYPQDADNEVTLAEYMKELIKEEDEETRTDEYLRLPETAGDTQVVYEEAYDNNAVVFIVMTIILAAGMYFREDKELGNKVKERDKQLIADYPGMVNKFVLFYSAGLTTKGIWTKLCRDYRERLDNGEDKRYLYEEMLICEGRMNEGVGELSAYEGFGARCGLHKYRHFISIIGQAVGKGRADMLSVLEREAGDAFAERKNRAKELGEEAGTKLLIPMLMMLLVVLIIVMVPAFISFRM